MTAVEGRGFVIISMCGQISSIVWLFSVVVRVYCCVIRCVFFGLGVEGRSGSCNKRFPLYNDIYYWLGQMLGDADKLGQILGYCRGWVNCWVMAKVVYYSMIQSLCSVCL